MKDHTFAAEYAYFYFYFCFNNKSKSAFCCR